MSGVGADGGDVIVAHDTGADAGIVPTVGAIGGGLVVVAVGGATGINTGIVSGVGICCAPVALGVARGVGIDKGFRWQVTDQAVVAVVAGGCVTVLADRFLLGVAGAVAVIGQQRSDILTVELVSQGGDVGGVTTGLVGGRNLGIAIVVWPVLASCCIAVTGVTAGLKGGIGIVNVTADTVAAGVVSGFVVGTAVEVADLGRMTGLADALERGVAIAGTSSAVGEAGDGVAADIGQDHGVEVILTVRIVTGDAVESISAAAASSVAVGEVSRHGPDGTMAVVTEAVALADNCVVEAADIIETVGVSQNSADMGRGFSVAGGTELVRCVAGGAAMAPAVIGGAGASRCSDTADDRGAVIAVTGFAGNTV